jgi:pSer/pThr/pTyr-binding forkhead associated (FHA) protein/chromosome segregation ATPase
MSQHPIDLFITSCGATAPLELNVSRPGGAGAERRVFERPFVVVGRDERSCLRLEDGEVSRRHAYLQQLGGRVFCVDLGSRTGIRWGGESRPAGWLRPDRTLQIGPFTLELATAARAGGRPGEGVAEEGDPLQDRANDPRLRTPVTVEVCEEDPSRSRLRMNRVLTLVGSSSACRVCLREAGVSRYHCSLVRAPEGVWVVDLLSRTGTFLNGQPVPWALVREGDRLQVGAYVLRVCYEGGGPDSHLPGLSAIPAGTGAAPALTGPLADRSATEVSIRVPALQAELEPARQRQRDAEALREQLADSQAECERLREQARVLEAQVAEMARLQAQFEAAEATARQLDVVRAERDRWQAESQALQAGLESASADREQLGRLAADLRAAQVERDRLRTEHQASLHSAEQARVRVGHLERALQEATEASETALAEARTGWESERQALAARLEQERQAYAEAAEAGFREAQARAAAEREEWRQRLEAAQRHFAQEREALGAAGERLDHEAATLRGVRADLAARTAEHGAALRRLQEAQDDLARSQDKARALQAELDQARERQRDAEGLRQQLADARAEHELLHARVPELEGRATSADRLRAELQAAGAEVERLRVQLRAAESRAAEAEAVRAECGRWQDEARAARAGFERADAERQRLGGLAGELDAVRAERDRLAAEHQGATQAAGQARARVGELERSLAEAAAAHEAERADLTRTLEGARTRWESERQALAARLEQERMAHAEAAEAGARDAQARAAEREEWRQRLEAAQRQFAREREALQARGEQARQQAALLREERDGLAARLAEAESSLRAAEERSREEAGRAAAELERLREQAARTQGHDELAEQARLLRAEIDRERAYAEEQGRHLTALERELQAARAGAAAGRERLAAVRNAAPQVVEQAPEVTPDAGGENTVEHRSAPGTTPAVQADAGEPSPLSETPQGSPAPPEDKQPEEDIHLWLRQRLVGPQEERQGLWQKLRNFVLGK